MLTNVVSSQSLIVNKHIEFFNSPYKIPDRYIVKYKDEAVNSEKALFPSKSLVDISYEFTIDMAINSQSGIIDIYNHIIFGSVLYSPNGKKIHELLWDERVESISAVTLLEFHGTQFNPEWALDRLDQTDLPLNFLYEYANDGSNVDLYVVDSGIDNNHSEFNGRDIPEYDAYINVYLEPPVCTFGTCPLNINPYFTSSNSTDENGHGTQVAGIVGGTKYGVAKNVNLHSIKVSRDDGPPNSASIVKGLEWLEYKMISNGNNNPPTIVNISIGGSNLPIEIEQVMSRLFFSHEVTLVASAGNGASTICSEPADYSIVISVGGSNMDDNNYYNTNFGNCVDIFAPGESITSSTLFGGVALLNGTSYSAPHVAGAAALYLHEYPNASPDQVKTALIDSASNIDIADAGSPDKLLNVANLLPDMYEDDDSLSQISIFESGIQNRNFVDDNADFVRSSDIVGAVTRYMVLNFTNLEENVDICVNTYRRSSGDFVERICGINNSNSENVVSIVTCEGRFCYLVDFEIQNQLSAGYQTGYTLNYKLDL